MQESFFAKGVQKDRRRGVGLTERTQPRLRDYVSNAFHSAEVHDTFWSSATGLQRPSVYIWWCTRSWGAQGKQTKYGYNVNILELT